MRDKILDCVSVIAMKLQVNGNEIEVAENATVADLIIQLGLEKKRIAVELNQQIITKSSHSDTQLSEHDQIEIIHAIGGG